MAASVVDSRSSVEPDEPSKVVEGHLESRETSPQAEASEEDVDTTNSVNKLALVGGAATH